ncbi:unnamed protein product [Sphagnum balticum]
MPTGSPSAAPGPNQPENEAPSTPDDANLKDLGQVLAAAQLTEGPQLYRKWKLGTYNFQQNIRVANALGQYLAPPTYGSDPTSTDYQQVNGVGTPQPFLGSQFAGQARSFAGQILQNATNANGTVNNPFPVGPKQITPQMLQIASTTAAIVGHINSHLGTEATIGQTFGYGPGAGGNAILGVNLGTRDISTSQRVGQAFAQEQNYLTGRNTSDLGSGQNLNSSQATSVLDSLANQGFSMNPNSASGIPFLGDYTGTPQGDAATIANQFDSPLMSQMPGLSAQTLDQFTPALRNSATSASQLAEALSNVGIQSRNAKETVNEFTTSLASAAQSFANMGSGFANSIGTSTGFSQATGLDNQVASQLAQSPIVQGLALGQGVLPSGLGSMGGGAFTNTSLSAVKLLSQGLKGLDYNTYSTKDGTSIMTRNGQAMEDAQIASMLGIPESVVQRMLGSGTRYQHVADAENVIGDSTNGLGIFGAYQAALNSKGQVTGANRQTLNRDWSVQAVPALQKAGLSKSTIDKLSADKNWKQRLQDTNKDLSKIGGGGDFNKINGTSVTIGLTPAAAKVLQINQPSTNKILSNSGGQAINIATNSPSGDVTNMALRSGLSIGQIEQSGWHLRG